MTQSKRVINVKVLPGQPAEEVERGAGRVCIHLFVQDTHGRFVEPHALHPVVKNGEPVKQQVEAKPTRGRLACDPKRNPAPVTRNGITTVTHRTDDPRAVTCPLCLTSLDYQNMMEKLGST